ncbi:MAG: M48 family metallopeptidase [Armatimonadetes bacterium]|nr:M48 family metallopeptidase [Armatimonadota bacterium]
MWARRSTTWSGSYFDGRTANRIPVTITVMATGLRLATVEGTFLWWPYEQLHLAQGALPGEQIRIERGLEPSETLVVSDEAFLSAIREAAPTAGRHLIPMFRRRHWAGVVLLAGAGAVIAGLAIYLWAIPALAEVAAAQMPRAWEERLGQAALESLAPTTLRCADPQRDAALSEIVARLAAAGPGSAYTFRITVVDHPAVNAFAAPGGHLVVYLGMLRATQTPAEMAGVLAHEMQHILHRHGTKALFREVSMRALLSLAVGDAGGLGQALEAAGTLGQLRYRRQDEEAADRDGMSLIQAARIDPNGMIGFLRRLSQEGPGAPHGLAYLSTHPLTAERIRQLERMAARASHAPVALLPEYPWREIGRSCAAAP